MTTLPSLFVSHGAPTFANEPGLAGAQLRVLGRALGKPKAILVVSPHWMTRGVEVTAAAQPQTVHDFGGFPRALYAIQYPAPGAPELAARAREVLKAQGIAASLDPQRGLDHGAWSRCCTSTRMPTCLWCRSPSRSTRTQPRPLHWAALSRRWPTKAC
jgi:4,5-DOPA dioxygenase extradiol